MKLIADGGSTKTDWALVEDNKMVAHIHTDGANPYFMSVDELSKMIADSPLAKYSRGAVDEIWFYGSGCTKGEKSEMVKEALSRVFGNNCCIEVESDMLGAARALCGREEGVACILGTGSNSCLYDGNDIVANVSPLGFILGDEGSGANLGKLLVGNVLKDQTTPELKQMFFEETGTTVADIIDRVYRKPYPNRWLASLAPFILQHMDCAPVCDMVKCAFVGFFKRNVFNYKRKDLPVSLTGSIAYYYGDIIREVSKSLGLTIGKIEKSPLEGLIKYHG